MGHQNTCFDSVVVVCDVKAKEIFMIRWGRFLWQNVTKMQGSWMRKKSSLLRSRNMLKKVAKNIKMISFSVN